MADTRRDLLDAINDFLQDSIVLPPGEYNQKTLQPIVDMARKKHITKHARRPDKEPSAGMIAYNIQQSAFLFLTVTFLTCIQNSSSEHLSDA